MVGGDLTNALIGELRTSYARTRGVADFVINGAIRDLDVTGNGDLPVYAAGVTHRAPYKDVRGEINVPIAIGGMLIEPGQLILGDADGVLAVPLARPTRFSPRRAPRAKPSARHSRTSPRGGSTRAGSKPICAALAVWRGLGRRRLGVAQAANPRGGVRAKPKWAYPSAHGSLS